MQLSIISAVWTTQACPGASIYPSLYLMPIKLMNRKGKNLMHNIKYNHAISIGLVWKEMMERVLDIVP